MIARRHRRRRELAGVELELTAFINPMVVLVTFLLMNVVFSHSAVLDLRLPGPGSPATAVLPQNLQLEVILRKDKVEIADRVRGVLTTVPNAAAGPDAGQIAEQLLQLKGQYPDEKKATVLAEPDVSYNDIVQVMDATRSIDHWVQGHRLITELFPQIALGDAPEAGSK